jgi:hypothetical protein
MLKITTDGRRAALDLRLVAASSVGSPSPTVPRPLQFQCKTSRCAQNVFALWREHAADRAAQIVFCDVSVPKNEFNLYDELKELLIEMGSPSNEIAFVHDHDAPSKREKLHAKVRSGEVRVLIGSTFKLGLGTNVQERLAALHHLDVPWRPADMIQREGRILRPGNVHKSVKIFRYVTEGSFDAYSWQILENKQRFIAQFLGRGGLRRDCAELDEAVLSYAEVKALAMGDPLMRERVEAATALERLRLLRVRWLEERDGMRREIQSLPGKIESLKTRLADIEMDKRAYELSNVKLSAEERRSLGERILEAQNEHALADDERRLFTYQGFEVTLPAGMTPEKPGLWLIRNGRYKVENGDDALGCVIRIDNKLRSLAEIASDCESEIADLSDRLATLEQVSGKPEPHLEEIELLEERLADLDARLDLPL